MSDTKNETELALLNQKLQLIEKLLETGNLKVEVLIQQVTEDQIDIAVIIKDLERVKQDIVEQKDINKSQEEKIQDVKLTLAQKIGYSVAGGGTVALLLEILIKAFEYVRS